MRSSLRSTLAVLALTASAVLALSGCAGGSAEPAASEQPSATASPTAGAGCDGVRVVVNFGALDAEPVDACVETDEAIDARTALESAGVETEGTIAYGDASVCRVDGRPAADETVTVEGFGDLVETCESFTEGMYWALWEQRDGGDWAYAMVGLNELEFAPGEALGLAFTTGDGGAEVLPEA